MPFCLVLHCLLVGLLKSIISFQDVFISQFSSTAPELSKRCRIGVWEGVILVTCPAHLSRVNFRREESGSLLVTLNRSSFNVLSFQVLPIINLRHLARKHSLDDCSPAFRATQQDSQKTCFFIHSLVQTDRCL